MWEIAPRAFMAGQNLRHCAVQNEQGCLGQSLFLFSLPSFLFSPGLSPALKLLLPQPPKMSEGYLSILMGTTALPTAGTLHCHGHSFTDSP